MKSRYALLGVAAIAATLAACGGGGGGGGASVPPVISSSSPAPVNSTAPASQTMSVHFSTTATTPVSFAAITGGITSTMTLPISNVASTANLLFETSLPSSVATPQMRALKGRAVIGGSNLSTLAVVTLGVGAPVSITSTPAFSFTLPSAVSGNAYIAYFDENQSAIGWNVLAGPGSVSGNTVTFAAQQLNTPMTFQAGDTYVFALITSSSAVAKAVAPTYAGTKTINFIYGFEFGYPSPVPSATAPPATLSYNVTTAVNTGSSPFPGPSTTGLVDEHVSESDVSNLETTQYTTDSWELVNQSNGLYVTQLYGQTQQEPSSSTQPMITTLYGTPQTLDQFPQSNSAMWTNVPTSSVAYTYSDGDSGNRTVAADGTYSDYEYLLAGGVGNRVVMSENADGSGLMQGPFAGGLVTSVAFSAPSPSPSSSPMYYVNATISYSRGAQYYYNLPPSVTKQDLVWYATPPSFYSEQDTVTTGVALPALCTPNSYGSSANDVKRTITQLDTLIGDTEKTTLDSYEVNGYPICLTTTDTVNYAYDEQGNTPYFIVLRQLGLEIVTTQESLILQPGVNTAAATAQKAFVAALQAHQLSGFVRARAVRERTFLQSMRSRTNAQMLKAIKGGK